MSEVLGRQRCSDVAV